MGRQSVKRVQMVEAEYNTANVGDTLHMDGPSQYVRLPDGSVVTARHEFTFRHPGEYVITNAGDGTETTVTVGASPADEPVSFVAEPDPGNETPPLT